MTAVDCLKRVLKNQALDPDGAELKRLREKREQVEELLRTEFEDSDLVIRYGGSKASGTMIRESYDLDLPTYFRYEDTGAGETLEKIYNNVAKALEKEFVVERKRSALRLKQRVEGVDDEDLRIDVVPGRFVDDSETDAFLHQEGVEKNCLKTNLDKHIEHVKQSGVRDAIKLQKLWRVRRTLQIKTFILVLLIIDELDGAQEEPLDDQLIRVWRHFRDHWETLAVKDPANEEGNDLSDFLTEAVRRELRDAANDTLRQLDETGWEAVFGPVPEEDSKAKGESIRRIAAGALTTAAKPWAEA